MSTYDTPYDDDDDDDDAPKSEPDYEYIMQNKADRWLLRQEEMYEQWVNNRRFGN